MNKDFVDFFAGMGLVQLGLSNWQHCLSVDHSPVKARAYENHFGSEHSNHYLVCDVINVSGKDLPKVFLAHASFPCTDVSAAGAREGSQDGKESSAIDSFLRILNEMNNSKPSLVMLENVKGLLTANKGNDLRFLVQRLNKLGYIIDLLCLNAKNFVPQSRDRVFIIGHHKGHFDKVLLPKENLKSIYTAPGKDRSIGNFIANHLDLEWTHFPLPELPLLSKSVADIVLDDATWWSEERTQYLHSQMFDRHKNWIQGHIDSKIPLYATAFRRMRVRDGKKQSTAELRTDGIAGCLRTAKGGSAKQILIRVCNGKLDARLLSSRECALLMGAEKYKLSGILSENDWLYCFGDAVCVNVIEWLDTNYLTPIYEEYSQTSRTIELVNVEVNVNMDLNEESYLQAQIQWDGWATEHMDNKTNLPIKGRVYGALIILNNIETGHWPAADLIKATSTDKGEFFTDRSIKNHTNHRIGLILSERGLDYLIPRGGEQGRTSTGTKRAGLDLLKAINTLVDVMPSGKNTLEQLVSFFYKEAIGVLEQYNSLGGIDVPYTSNENISAFIRNNI